MRVATAMGGMVLGLGIATAAIAAPPARNTPEDIICAVTSSCGTAAPDAGGRIRVGDEKAFSLAKSAGQPPAAPAAPAFGSAPHHAAAAPRAPHRIAAARPRVRRAGQPLDMLVTFDQGSATMTDQARSEAQAFARAMAAPQLSGMRFAIEGHTDAVGNRAYNLDLSQRRAQSVVDYLVSQGVEPQRLEAHGYGFDKPKPGLKPRAAGNRRVEFVKRG